MTDLVRQDERDRALGELRAAVGRGTLDLSDFEQRAARVARADDHAEIDELLAGLDQGRAERELRRREWRDYAAEWR